MNTFSPQKVKDGFILRWSKQSLELIVRNPIVWIIYLTSLFFISMIEAPIYIRFMFAAFFVIIGFNIMALSDSKHFTISNFFLELKNSVFDFYIDVSLKRISYFVTVILLIALHVYFPEKPKTSTEVNINFLFYKSFLFFFLGVIAFGPSSNLYFHYFRKFFNTDDKDIISQSCLKAMSLNVNVVLFFNVYILVNFIIVSYILPILILVLAPLTLGFIYLSFREIFLGKDNNEEIKEEVKETSPIIQLN